MNSKESIQNTVNQKELSQRNNSVPSLKLEQNSEQKLLENQITKSVKRDVN